MTSNFMKLMLATAIGVGLGVSVVFGINAVAEPRPNSNYTQDIINVYGDNVYILEDHKRNRLCYLSASNSGNRANGISCGILNRNDAR